MNQEKDSKENPQLCYAILLIVGGLVAFNWIRTNQTIIIHAILIIFLELLLLLWFGTIIFLCIRSAMFQDDTSRIILKAMIHITNITIIASFIYSLFTPHVVSAIFIIHGTISMLLFMYYNYAIPKSLNNIYWNYKTKKSNNQILEDNLKKFINTNLKRLSLEELQAEKYSHQCEKYSEDIIEKYHQEYWQQIRELNRLIGLKTQELEIEEIKIEKHALVVELEKIRREKELLLMDESSKKAQKEYALTHRDENVIPSNRLSNKISRAACATLF